MFFRSLFLVWLWQFAASSVAARDPTNCINRSDTNWSIGSSQEPESKRALISERAVAKMQNILSLFSLYGRYISVLAQLVAISAAERELVGLSPATVFLVFFLFNFFLFLL